MVFLSVFIPDPKEISIRKSVLKSLLLLLILPLPLIGQVVDQDATWKVFRTVNHVTALAETDEELWVGTQEKGIMIMDKGTGSNRFLAYGDENFRGEKEGMVPFNTVKDMTVTSKGVRWVLVDGRVLGSFDDGGLVRFHNDQQYLYKDEHLGFDNASLLDIEADPKGDLWILLEKGSEGKERQDVLVRFDGEDFYPNSLREDELGVDLISDIAVDEDGHVWGIARMRDKKKEEKRGHEAGRKRGREEPMPLSSDTKDQLHDYPLEHAEEKRGAKDTGLVEFDGEEWKHHHSGNSELPSNDLANLSSSDSGSGWVLSGKDRLCQLSKNGIETHNLPRKNGDKEGKRVSELQPVGGDSLYVCYGKMVQVYDGENWDEKWELPPSDSQVTHFHVTKRGEGWISRDGELFHLTGQGPEKRPELELPLDRAKTIAISPEGRKWIGTSGQRMKSYSSEIHNARTMVYESGNFEYVTHEHKGNKYPMSFHQGVNIIDIGPKGTKWIGTEEGGVVRYKDGMVNSFHEDNSILSRDSWIEHLAVDDSGKVWMIEEGVVEYNGLFWHRYDTSNSRFPTMNPGKLIFGPEGSLWTGHGFIERTNGEWRTHLKGFPDEPEYPKPYQRVRADVWTIDEKGRKWYAGEDGLAMKDGQDWETFIPANDSLMDTTVFDLEIGPNGDKWMITGYGRFIRFDGEEWSAHHGSEAPLWGQWLSDMAIAPSGRIWICSPDAGLVRYKPPE